MIAASVPLLSRLPKFWPAVAAFLLMGGLVCLLLPNMVVTLDDDFWYLRSVIKTYQKGRPWTDDWLTPWAASASTISALLFELTGSFRFAIHGQLAACAGLAAMACSLFLKRQGLSSLPAMTAPVLLLATPTVLFMFLMFTGVALYMACLWWCLLLADRRQWLWFLLPWGLAVASRQSAVAWLALPGWALVTEAWNHRTWLPRTPQAGRLMAFFAVAAGIVAACKLGMNQTEGQKLVLGSVGSALFTSHGGIPSVLGLIVFAAGLGLASLLKLPALWSERNCFVLSKQRLALAPLLAGAGAGGASWFRSWSQNTHACYYDSFSAWILPVMGAVLGTALALSATRPRTDATLAGLGATLLVALYGGRFDYYFNDALFFGMAAGFPLMAATAKIRPGIKALEIGNPMARTAPDCDRSDSSFPSFRRSRLAACSLVIIAFSITALWHSRSAVRLAAQQAHGAAGIVLYEQAMRTGKLRPEQVGMATFGYLGWLFQDYYAAHDGRSVPVLGGFSRYAQHWGNGRGTGMLTTLPRPLHPWRHLIPTHNTAALRDAPDVPVLLEIRRPLFGHAIRYALLHGPSGELQSGSLPINPALYQRIPFPLNDKEWRQLVRNAPPMR